MRRRKSMPLARCFRATFSCCHFARAEGVSMSLPDISAAFLFRQWTHGNYRYKEASGDLGVPGNVMTHRIVSAQRNLSGGTGEHAGHLIAIEFGAPGDVRNLGLQNPT
jgi:hypothetical protein